MSVVFTYHGHAALADGLHGLEDPTNPVRSIKIPLWGMSRSGAGHRNWTGLFR